jgi:NADP-dependent 3-hydroxy acid dehydrogenase YdfG
MKTLLITGGFTGIGKALVEQFHHTGHQIILGSRKIINNQFRDGIYEHQLDVCDPLSIEKLFLDLEQQHFKLDVLINNAGIGVFKPIIDVSLEEWDLVMNTNLRGTFLCSQAAIKQMRLCQGGRIINLCSIIEKYPRPMNALYGASKAAIQNFSQHLNEELKFDKIRFTHILLGATDTAILHGRNLGLSEQMLKASAVAEEIFRIALLPLDIRIDTLEILPEAGVL